MKLFDMNSDEKLTDKVFSQNLIVSVVSILLCIVALCSMTYAWLKEDLSSGENTLESSRFSLDIVVDAEDNTSIAVNDNGNGSFTCTLPTAGRYTVVLSMTDDTTATKGYCDVTVGSESKMQTKPVSKDTAIGTNPFMFIIETNQANTVVTFVPKWGLAASAEIKNGDLLKIGGSTGGESDDTQGIAQDSTQGGEQESTQGGEQESTQDGE